MLLGSNCSVCARSGPSLCERCIDACRPAPGFAAPPGLDTCSALLVYDDASRPLIIGLKYRNARSVLTALGSALAELVIERASGEIQQIDMVTWAPTSLDRLRLRGFDQAELLARAVARRLRLPLHGLLSRASGPAQTRRTQIERQIGPVFNVPRNIRLGPSVVLIVDDVITTGATLSAAACALRGAGVGQVHGLAAAHTPRIGISPEVHSRSRALWTKTESNNRSKSIAWDGHATDRSSGSADTRSPTG